MKNEGLTLNGKGLKEIDIKEIVPCQQSHNVLYFFKNPGKANFV